MVNIHETAAAGFHKAESLSPSWARGSIRLTWDFLDKANILRFRGFYELQSHLSTWTMIYLLLWVDSNLAIGVNIVWSITVAALYWWLLQKGQPDLMEHPAENSASGLLATGFVLWSIGWRQLLWKWFHGLFNFRSNKRVGNLCRRTVAYGGVVLFGVTPGHYLLKTEGHSPGWILALNCLARVPNAWVKKLEILLSFWIAKFTWFLFWDYAPNPPGLEWFWSDLLVNPSMEAWMKLIIVLLGVAGVVLIGKHLLNQWWPPIDSVYDIEQERFVRGPQG